MNVSIHQVETSLFRQERGIKIICKNQMKLVARSPRIALKEMIVTEAISPSTHHTHKVSFPLTFKTIKHNPTNSAYYLTNEAATRLRLKEVWSKREVNALIGFIYINLFYPLSLLLKKKATKCTCLLLQTLLSALEKNCDHSWTHTHTEEMEINLNWCMQLICTLHFSFGTFSCFFIGSR